jgi:hypothetical protein
MKSDPKTEEGSKRLYTHPALHFFWLLDVRQLLEKLHIIVIIHDIGLLHININFQNKKRR